MRLELPAMMEIAAASELRALLDSALEGEDNDIQLDGEAVARVDASALQLLTCFVQHAAADAKTVTWQAASEELHVSARLLDLSDKLNLV